MGTTYGITSTGNLNLNAASGSSIIVGSGISTTGTLTMGTTYGITSTGNLNLGAASGSSIVVGSTLSMGSNNVSTAGTLTMGTTYGITSTGNLNLNAASGSAIVMGSTLNMGSNTINTSFTPASDTNVVTKIYADTYELNGLYLNPSSTSTATLALGGQGIMTPGTPVQTTSIFSSALIPTTTGTTLFSFKFTNTSSYLLKKSNVYIYMGATGTNTLTYTCSLNLATSGIILGTGSTTSITLTGTTAPFTSSIPISSTYYITDSIILTVKGNSNVSNSTLVIPQNPTPYIYFKVDETVYPSLTPIGTILPYAGIRNPFGYVWCDGTTYNSSGIFADLFNVISTYYGGTSPNFNVPDLRGRFIAGSTTTTLLKALDSGINCMGGSSSISTSNMPSHNHSVTLSYSNSTSFGGGVISTAYDILTGYATDNGYSGGGSKTGVIGVQASNLSVSTGTAGSGTAYYQPHLSVNYVIKY